MENSYNELSSSSVLSKLDLLTNQNLEFNSELCSLMLEIENTAGSDIIVEIQDKFDLLQDSWETFCKDTNSRVAYYQHKADLARKQNKIRMDEEKRVRKLNDKVISKEKQLLNKEKELSRTLEIVHGQ